MSATTHVSEPPLDWPYYGIGFGAAITRFFKKYATFTGRASRGEYWWYALFSAIITFVLYGIVLGISAALGVFSFLAWRQAKKILASMGQGIALRLGRPGVEIAGAYVPWGDLGTLAVTKGKLGHGPQFTVTRTDGHSLSVPLDQLQVATDVFTRLLLER